MRYVTIPTEYRVEHSRARKWGRQGGSEAGRKRGGEIHLARRAGGKASDTSAGAGV